MFLPFPFLMCQEKVSRCWAKWRAHCHSAYSNVKRFLQVRQDVAMDEPMSITRSQYPVPVTLLLHCVELLTLLKRSLSQIVRTYNYQTLLSVRLLSNFFGVAVSPNVQKVELVQNRRSGNGKEKVFQIWLSNLGYVNLDLLKSYMIEICFQGQCGDIGPDCQSMGYYADLFPARGIFHLNTNKKSPFCKPEFSYPPATTPYTYFSRDKRHVSYDSSSSCKSYVSSASLLRFPAASVTFLLLYYTLLML